MTDPVARTVKDFCQAYGVGKTLTYELIASGAIVAKKAGNRTLITEESAQRKIDKARAALRAAGIQTEE